MGKCSECESISRARGLCWRHYRLARADGSILIRKTAKRRSGVETRLRLHSRLDESGCIIWTAYRDRFGYGRIGVKDSNSVLAHRVAYEFYVGPIPEGMGVLHRCDVPACINPEHLFIGTPLDNSNDKVSKGRDRKVTGEKHWKSKLTADQVLEIRGNKGVQDQIARQYGVCQSTISSIKSMKIWRGINK